MNAGAIQLRAALVGDFDAEVSAGRNRVGKALQLSVFTAGGEFQSKLRLDVAGSRLARAAQLQKTWRLREYANSGLNPAVLIYSSFPLVQLAFEAGALIRSSHGFFLPIPNPDVWPTGRVPRPRRRGPGRSTTIAIAEQRFGPLRFIYRPGKASLLVAEVRESASRPGSFRKASDTARRTGRGLATIIVFFLVKQAKLPKLLHGAEIRRRAERDFPARVGQLFPRYFEAADGAPLQLAGPAE